MLLRYAMVERSAPCMVELSTKLIQASSICSIDWDLKLSFEISVMKDTFCEAVNDVDLKKFLKGENLDAQTLSVLLFAVLRQIFCLRAYTLVICSYKAFYSGRPLICICDSSFYDRKRQTLYLFSTHCFTTRTSTAVLNQGGYSWLFYYSSCQTRIAKR